MESSEQHADRGEGPCTSQRNHEAAHCKKSSRRSSWNSCRTVNRLENSLNLSVHTRNVLIAKEGIVKIRYAMLMIFTLAGLINPASAGVWQFTEDFELPAPSGWFTGGGAGFDFNRGLAHQGNGNAWVRFTQGWNAVNRWVPSVPQNADCSAQAFVRVSAAVTGGYFSSRGGNGSQPSPVINEVELIGP